LAQAELAEEETLVFQELIIQAAAAELDTGAPLEVTVVLGL
jgi:hypothetical protein